MGPETLRQPLTDLLKSIEEKNADKATELANSLIIELDKPRETPVPGVGKPGDAPVRFSGLYYAILRDVRNSVKHIGEGKWVAAASAIKGSIGVLPTH